MRNVTSVMHLGIDPETMAYASQLEAKSFEQRLFEGCRRVIMFFEYYFPDRPNILATPFVEEIADDPDKLAIVRKRVAHWKTLECRLKDIVIGFRPELDVTYMHAKYYRTLLADYPAGRTFLQ